MVAGQTKRVWRCSSSTISGSLPTASLAFTASSAGIRPVVGDLDGSRSFAMCPPCPGAPPSGACTAERTQYEEPGRWAGYAHLHHRQLTLGQLLSDHGSATGAGPAEEA